MTQWYDHTGLSFLHLIHEFDCRILSTMLLSNLYSPSYTKRFSNKLGKCVRISFTVHAYLTTYSSIPCPLCTQAGSPGQIKADLLHHLQCWCLVLLFLFPSFSEAAHVSETTKACFNRNYSNLIAFFLSLFTISDP